MFGATVANTGSQRHLKFVKDIEQMMVNDLGCFCVCVCVCVYKIQP